MTSVPVEVPDGIVYLAPRLTNPMGAAAMAALNGIPSEVGPMQAALTQIYLSPAPAGGIVAWSFTEDSVNDQGQTVSIPVPITPDNIERLIPWTNGGAEVCERADALYAEDLFRPLVERRQRSFPPSPTEPSTSPSPPSGSTRQRRSRRSSQNGTAGMVSVAPVP